MSKYNWIICTIEEDRGLHVSQKAVPVISLDADGLKQLKLSQLGNEYSLLY